jgi:transglutaminase-like putative cysteine protease
LPSAGRRLRRSFHLAPDEGWLPLLLLAVAVYSVVYSVTSAIVIEHSNILLLTTALGLLCGLLVAKSRNLPQVALHIGACILGYWLALFATGLLAYHVSILTILANLRSVIANGFALAGSQESTMVFLFYLAFLCFFLGYFGAWLIYRAHLPWLVALVYIAIMIVNLNYIAKRDLAFLMVLLVGSLLLLIARVHLANQLLQWKNEGLYTDRVWLRSLTSRFLRITALFALLILPLSWLLPVAGEPASGVAFWNGLDNAWANLTHGNLPALNNPGNLFSPYNPPTNFFGDQLTITGSVNLPHGPVLSYMAGFAQGEYLEGFTFDSFDGHTWTAQAAAASQSYQAMARLPLDNTGASYHTLTTTITVIQPPEGTKHFIFAPAQPGSFTVPVTVFTAAIGTITSAWTQTAALRPQEHYQVTSEVSLTSPADLALVAFTRDDQATWAADPNYQALRQYYLQTPAHLSPEVLSTAQTWTAGAQDVYSAVLALQKHLNNAADFTYAVTNPPVPQDIDAVTWLLHSRRGYCTYYATAMTVMARLLGIPARVVNGFSQGQYSAQQRAWIVDGSDAHSWVQVYFPGTGWVNFDPTPGFSLNTSTSTTTPPATTIVTPTPVHLTPTPGNGKAPTQPTIPPHGSSSSGATSGTVLTAGNLFLAFSLLCLLCSCVVLTLAVARYRSGRPSSSPIASVYVRLCRLAGLIGMPPAVWQTPYEFTFVLCRRFPQAATVLRRVADLFVRERWASPEQAPAPGEQREMQHLWPRLRNMLLRGSFARRP